MFAVRAAILTLIMGLLILPTAPSGASSQSQVTGRHSATYRPNPTLVQPSMLFFPFAHQRRLVSPPGRPDRKCFPESRTSSSPKRPTWVLFSSTQAGSVEPC